MPPNNGAVLTVSQIIKGCYVIGSRKAELGALYINAREAVPARRLFKEMGHPQPPTPMQTDNSTALGVVTNITSSPSKLRQWTCGSIGFGTEKPENSLDFTGAQESPTGQTITRSITVLRITNRCDHIS